MFMFVNRKSQNFYNREVTMKKLRTVALVAAVCLFSTGNVGAAELSIGGQVPLIAEVMGMGFTSLDLSVDAANAVIGRLIVSCNAPSFDLNFTAENGLAAGADPQFEQIGGGAGVIVTTVFTATPPSGGAQGTLGTGGVAPAVDLVANDSDEAWSVTQTTATDDYVIDLTASWSADATNLAGFYKETIIVTISPEL